MRITIDTAILVRTNAKATGPARQLLDIIQQCEAVLVLSPFLLQEVERVLGYARVQAIYQLSDAEIRQHIEYLQSIAEIVIPAEGPRVVIKDADDDPVIYTALAGGADVICTVDRHFYEPDVLAFCSRQGIQLMTEVELLHALRTQ
ncbi:MAG: putative toxin-antitoxin system toxin component, PIN family [Bryobacteraceae bacterium]